MHQLFDWKRLASESNESTEGFDQILMKLLESSAEGPRYHKGTSIFDHFCWQVALAAA